MPPQTWMGSTTIAPERFRRFDSNSSNVSPRHRVRGRWRRLHRPGQEFRKAAELVFKGFPEQVAVGDGVPYAGRDTRRKAGTPRRPVASAPSSGRPRRLQIRWSAPCGARVRTEPSNAQGQAAEFPHEFLPGACGCTSPMAWQAIICRFAARTRAGWRGPLQRRAKRRR